MITEKCATPNGIPVQVIVKDGLAVVFSAVPREVLCQTAGYESDFQAFEGAIREFNLHMI